MRHRGCGAIDVPGVSLRRLVMVGGRPLVNDQVWAIAAELVQVMDLTPRMPLCEPSAHFDYPYRWTGRGRTVTTRRGTCHSLIWKRLIAASTALL